MAKSKIKKGFNDYLMVFLVIVIGVICVIGSILVFNPGKDVLGLGIRFVSHTSSKKYYHLTSSNTLIEDLEFDTVNFVGDYASFKVDYSEDENNASIILNPKMSALSKSDKVNIDFSIESSGSALNITISEPDVWIGFSTKIEVVFVCPKNSNYSNCSFNTKTNSGAISITPYDKISLKNFSAKSETGDISIPNTVKITNNVSITTNTSKINIGTNSIQNLFIKNTYGKINISKLKGNLEVVNSGRLELNCGKIDGNLSIKSNLGYASINELGKFLHSVDSLENTNIDANKVLGDVSVTTASGHVNINQIGGQALIETKSGFVNIGSISAKTEVRTESGSINVTQKGDVQTTLNSVKGTVTANFANSFSNDFTANVISQQDNVFVNIPTGKALVVNYHSHNGINVSWKTTQLEANGQLLISGATESCGKVVNVYATNGSIDVKDGFNS